MKLRNLSTVFAVGAIALGTTSAYGESAPTASNTIFCDLSNGTPTTMAKSAKEGNIPIFHWQSEALPKSLNSEELCHSVSQKLENHLSKGGKLVAFGTHDQAGLPTVCAEETIGRCSLVLFTLPPTQDLAASNRILDSILNDNLKQEQLTSSTERGVQGHLYPVNFWTLLGF